MSGKHTTLHRELIEQARGRGWETGPWKKAVRERLGHESLLVLFSYADRKDELDSVRFEAEQIIETVNEINRIPDAWRFRMEGFKEGWLKPVLAIEVLEVEVTSRMTPGKFESYDHLWWRADATDMAHFRLFTVDHYGAETARIDGYDSVEGRLVTRAFAEPEPPEEMEMGA